MLKKSLRFLATLFVPLIGALLIRLLWSSNRKVFHAPEHLPETPFIMACWHGQLLMIPYAYTKYRKIPRVKLLISEHFDGNLIAKTLSFFGFGTIRGSSTRGGAKALISSIKEMKNGYDIGITPDGPKGPRHHVQDGIIAMAHKAKVPIVLVEIHPSSYWQLGSWDKFVIPKPFGIISYYISDAIDVSDMDAQGAKRYIEKGLLAHE